MADLLTMLPVKKLLVTRVVLANEASLFYSNKTSFFSFLFSWLLQVRPTNFRAATDGVSMLKIAGHPNGRVFMAGKDGNMYELSYSVSYGFMYSVFFVGDATGARKCKRVRHRCERLISRL